jgi:hypothetical protein
LPCSGSINTIFFYSAYYRARLSTDSRSKSACLLSL